MVASLRGPWPCLRRATRGDICASPHVMTIIMDWFIASPFFVSALIQPGLARIHGLYTVAVLEERVKHLRNGDCELIRYPYSPRALQSLGPACG